MKPVKTFGFAALLTLTMAFVGSSSAMAEATVLCTSDENPCAEENEVNHVHEVGQVKLLATFLVVECNVLSLGEVLAGVLPPRVIIHGTFAYKSCGGCTVSEENGPAETIILRLGHEVGDVTGESLIHVECGARFICDFSGVGMKGTAKGPLLSTQANGEVAIQKQTVTLESGGFLCPETAKLDIITTPLSPTYISS